MLTALNQQMVIKEAMKIKRVKKTLKLQLKKQSRSKRSAAIPSISLAR